MGKQRLVDLTDLRRDRLYIAFGKIMTEMAWKTSEPLPSSCPSPQLLKPPLGPLPPLNIRLGFAPSSLTFNDKNPCKAKVLMA